MNEQLLLLSQTAQSEPQAAYSAFVAEFKGKLTYYLRTIPDIKEHLDLLEETIRHQFIPAITGGKQCSNDERVLLSLPERYGGLGIPIFHSIAAFEYENSRKTTSTLRNLIKDQNTQYSIDQVGITNIKSIIKTQREIRYKEILDDLRSKMSLKQKRLNDVTQE